MRAGLASSAAWMKLYIRYTWHRLSKHFRSDWVGRWVTLWTFFRFYLRSSLGSHSSDRIFQHTSHKRFLMKHFTRCDSVFISLKRQQKNILKWYLCYISRWSFCIEDSRLLHAYLSCRWRNFNMHSVLLCINGLPGKSKPIQWPITTL